MSPFEPFRKLMREGDPPVTRLAQSLADARKIEADARAEVERLSALKVTLLDTYDAQLARNRNALAEARDKVEMAGSYVAELQKRHAAAEAAGAEQARLDRYNAARKQADAAEKVLAKDYPKMVTSALALLKTLAAAQVEVDAVNRDLPDGALPILDPEIAVRGVPGQGREVISDEEVERWVRLDHDQPVEDRFADEIQDCGNGWGKRVAKADKETGYQPIHDLQPAYLRARFRRVEYRDSVQSVDPLPLASYLRLPSVYGPGVAWGHHHTVGFDPALHAMAFGADAPEAIVVRVAEAEQVKPVKPAPAPAPTKIKWTMISYVGATGMTKSEPYTAGRSQAAKTGLPLGLNSRRAGGARR